MAAPINPRLLREARATRGFVIGIGVVGLIQAFLVIATATLVSTTVTTIFTTYNLQGTARAALLLAAVFTARGALTWATSVLAHRASAEVKSSLRRRVLAARLANPDTKTPTASLVTVMTGGLDALDGYFGKYLPQFLLCVTVPIIVGTAIGLQDLLSLAIIVVTVPIIPIFMVLIGRTTAEQVARRFRVQLRLANHFADLVAGLPTLQVFGRARAQEKGLQSSEDASRRQTLSTLRVAFLSAGVLELAATLSVAIIAVSIAFRVVAGGMGLETALFILVLAPEVYLPVRMVGVHFHDSSNGNAAAEAAFAIIDAAEARRQPGSRPQPDRSGSQPDGSRPNPLLALDNVSYRYPESDTDALAPLSLTVHPGEIVALAGPSGAGKSTALNLALGLLTPATGQVALGDTSIAWAGQIPGLLGPTVADDVALGLPLGHTPHRSSLRRALDRVGGESIPLDRAVGEDGEALSAGERRRVAMARALLRVERGGARLLLLDEPTAGLDEAREAQMLTTLRDLGVGILVVSHREAVLSAADRVIQITGVCNHHPNGGAR